MTQKERIIELMSDGEWHDNFEMRVKMLIFQAPTRMFELRKDGYVFQDRHEGSHWWWRMVNIRQKRDMEYAFGQDGQGVLI